MSIRTTRPSSGQRRSSGSSRFLLYFFELLQSHVPLGKGVIEARFPFILFHGQFLVGEEGFIQHRGEGFLIHLRSDEYDFLAAVTVGRFADAFDFGELGRIGWPLFPGHRGPEETEALVLAHRTRLRPVAG